MVDKQLIRIGTRGSRMALVQAESVASGIRNIAPGTECEIVVISTQGDRTQKDNIALHAIGGKELFGAEITRELRAGTIDCAVHCMKDLAAARDSDTVIAAMLQRDDPHDCFLGADETIKTIADMPHGAVLGCSGPRRIALSLRERPDLRVVPFRGNVPKRLEKLAQRQDGVTGTYLSKAGLDRLGLAPMPCTVLPVDISVPAAGQGVIGIEVRSNDRVMRDFINQMDHTITSAAVTAEKSALAILNGNCETAIGAYAAIDKNDVVSLHVRAFSLDGRAMIETYSRGHADHAKNIGIEAAYALLQQAGADAQRLFHFQPALARD